jgi:hypothetical protein
MCVYVCAVGIGNRQYVHVSICFSCKYLQDRETRELPLKIQCLADWNVHSHLRLSQRYLCMLLSRGT